jgi:hypothetical protein
MASYLSDVTADYTSTELDIPSHRVLVEEGEKRQYLHEYDDGDLDVVTASDSMFKVTLQWDWVSDTDAAIIMDFYENETKGAGTRRSFYWQHPVDGNTYTVKFSSDISWQDVVDFVNAKVIPSVTLKVLGNKP